MAQKKPAPEATYSEEFTARVNREGNHHEVILRGMNTPVNIVFHNQPGTRGFKDGVTYTVTFTENAPEELAEGETTETSA